MSKNAVSLTHAIRENSPDRTGPPPATILLHGLGSNEADLMALADYIDERYFVASVRAPIVMGDNSYGWYTLTGTPGRLQHDEDEAIRARDLVVRTIDELVDAYRLDTRRIILMGFSQGAILSAGVALSRPDKIAGAALMSGRLLDSFARKVPTGIALAGLPIIAVHGIWDPILPIAQAREMAAFLSQTPADLSFHEYPMGHEVSRESMAEIERWLKARL